ncbi:MAG: prepilin-type N-terminal cleavage/methylation domain-containing protein [Thermodesulfobacteriota bacterium]
MKISKDVGREEGFTLVEVLIAIVLVSVALISLAGLLTSTMINTNLGKNTTVAANLAQQKIESLKMMGAVDFDTVTDSASGSDPITAVNPDMVEDYGAIAGYPNFRREVYITDGSAPVNSKDVAVRVVWADSIGTHSNLLRTTLAR